MIDDLGGRVATIWSELRPATRGLVERALKTPNNPGSQTRNVPYDARADIELSRFLSALDERANDAGAALNRNEEIGLRFVADTCAVVLQEKTQSAEVFAQLVLRAEAHRDYKRVDALADSLTSRFAPSEICELARSADTFVRELANEALARFPTPVLVNLLSDPVDSEIARDALQRQVIEYGSEQAREIVTALFQNES